MQEHEVYTVRRRAEFVRIVDPEILPRYDGVMVKSHGDAARSRPHRPGLRICGTTRAFPAR